MAITQGTLIEARGLCKRFASHTVLDKVDLTIHTGEVVTLVGLNGCGKTTLLHILLGLQQADSGTVEHRSGLRIGYVPQRFHIQPSFPMTVKHFLALGEEAPDQAFIAEKLGVDHLLGRPMQGLSGGETQRVLLARALSRKPELLVLDEPVQGVDMAGQADLYALISRINRDYGVAVLMVSHDIHLVMAGTSRVLCLNRHICCSGAPHDVSRDPEFLRLFGERVASAVALYEHHHDHAHDLRGRVVEGDEAEGHCHVHGEGCQHG